MIVTICRRTSRPHIPRLVLRHLGCDLRFDQGEALRLVPNFQNVAFVLPTLYVKAVCFAWPLLYLKAGRVAWPLFSVKAGRAAWPLLYLKAGRVAWPLFSVKAGRAA
jgi:hypothetical protein